MKPIIENQTFGYFKPLIAASYLKHYFIFFFLEYRLINILNDHSFLETTYVLWYHNTKSIVAEFNNEFISSYTRDIYIGIKKYQKSFSNDLKSGVFASNIF